MSTWDCKDLCLFRERTLAVVVIAYYLGIIGPSMDNGHILADWIEGRKELSQRMVLDRLESIK